MKKFLMSGLLLSTLFVLSDSVFASQTNEQKSAASSAGSGSQSASVIMPMPVAQDDIKSINYPGMSNVHFNGAKKGDCSYTAADFANSARQVCEDQLDKIHRPKIEGQLGRNSGSCLGKYLNFTFGPYRERFVKVFNTIVDTLRAEYAKNPSMSPFQPHSDETTTKVQDSLEAQIKYSKDNLSFLIDWYTAKKDPKDTSKYPTQEQIKAMDAWAKAQGDTKITTFAAFAAAIKPGNTLVIKTPITEVNCKEFGFSDSSKLVAPLVSKTNPGSPELISEEAFAEIKAKYATLNGQSVLFKPAQESPYKKAVEEALKGEEFAFDIKPLDIIQRVNAFQKANFNGNSK